MNTRRLYFADDDDESQFEDFDNLRLRGEVRRSPPRWQREPMDLPPIPPYRPRAPQQFPALAQVIQRMDVDPQPDPVVVNPPLPPPIVPDADADRDYIDNLNLAFEQMTVENLVPPPPPVVRQPEYKLPSTGVDTTKHLVRHQIQVSELLAQQQQTINNLLFWVGNPDLQQANLGAMRTSAAQAATVALDLKAQAVHFQANMQRAAHVTDRYSSNPTMPDWTNIPRDAPMARPCDIVAACGKFDPKVPEPDFGIVWDNLRFYGTNLNFRENNYRMALSFLLEGEAKRIFNDHMDLNPIPPLSSIVEVLYKAYAKPRSTMDDKQALKDVVRNAYEPLPRCIARGTIAIDRQRYMHDQREWPVLRKNLIRELVYQVVEPPTQKFINWLENDSIATTGIVCDVDRLIEMVDQEERRHGWIPKMPRNVVFQAASTGIFSKQHDNRNPHNKKGKPSNPQHQHRRGQSADASQPQSQPNQPNRQPDHRYTNHPPKPKHQQPNGAGKPVPNFSVNATDFGGDDTMTGYDPSRGRGKKRPRKGFNRNQSVEAGQTRSKSDGRDYANKRSRGSSHSPGPSWNRKGKKTTTWQDEFDKTHSDYDGKSKKKGGPNPSSHNQSGSKNVIVRVDTAGLSGTFLLDKRNLIKDPSNVEPSYFIKDPRPEN